MLDLARRVKDARIGVRDFIEQEIEDAVYWVEKSGRDGDALTLNAAPINVAEHLRRIFFDGNKACILTSATLGVGESEPRLLPQAGWRGRRRRRADRQPVPLSGADEDLPREDDARTRAAKGSSASCPAG